ncbi:MAG: MauE/DoxX family redox-associated membrane protein [Nostocoides sp.]
MSPYAFALAPLILASVLGLSGAAKLRDATSTRSVIRLLRLPRILDHQWVAQALPVAEFVLALGLLMPISALFLPASVATAVLMGCYLAIVARAMRFDPRPSCGCFGRIGDQRINRRTLIRNILLALLSGVSLVVAARGETFWSLLADGGSQARWWLLGAIIGATVAVLVLGHGSEPRVTPPPAAATASVVQDPEEYIRVPTPLTTVANRQGEVRNLVELSASQPALLVMTNCFCGATGDVVDALPRWREALPALRVDYVTTIPFADHEGRGRGRAPDDGWYDHQSASWQALAARHSPAAVLLGADGLLAGGPVSGLTDIEDFVEEIAEAMEDFPSATDDGQLPAGAPA